MADLSEVESALVAAISQALYPNGIGQPSAIAALCKVFRGWPTTAELMADLKAGTVIVSVFPLPVEQNVSRFQRRWRDLPLPTAALTVAVLGNSVTLGGTPSSPLNVAVIVNKVGFVYTVQPGDTLDMIATGLAALIGAPATSNGPVLTVSGATSLVARIGVVSGVIRETKRQKRRVQMTIFAPSPDLRDAASKIIDPALSAIDFLSFPDGSAGRLIYALSNVDDGDQKENLWRRTLVYSVEYPTTQTAPTYQVVVERTTITGGTDPAAPVLSTIDQ
jgi:hypothetical protein